MNPDKKYRPYLTAVELNYLYELTKENPSEQQPKNLLANLKSWVLRVQEDLVAPALTIKERVPLEFSATKKSDSLTVALKSGTLSEEDEDALFASQMAQLAPQK